MNEQMFNEIFDSIKIIVNQEISNKLLPLSIEGKIVEKTKNKQYVIDYNNVKITAYPIATEYNIGDHVIVLLADGRINGKNKYILGKTDYRENIQQQLSKTLQEQIDDIKNDIQDISKDNQITPDEKISIAENWNGITSQFDMLVENMKKFNMDTTSIENLYGQYHDFVYSLILNDLNSVTKLTDEERNQWNTLSQQYFNEFTNLSNEVNTLLNSIIYSINIISDKSLQTKNETETFNLSYILFKNGLETSKTSETLKWIIDSNDFSTENNISYEYHKTDTPIDIKIELYNENGDLVAQDDKYITSFSDGIDGLQGPQGVPGKNGEDGKTYYTHIAYADNENGDGFSQSPLDKDYIGIAVNEKESDNDTDISEYQWSLIKGAQGPQGIPGKNGNFTHFAYMNTPDNSDNSFTISVNAQDKINNYIYLGQYTDKIESDSEDWQDYIWTKIKGEKGDKGEQGLQGIPGEQGVQGPKGDNGESSYTHIAYSNSSDGSIDFSTTVYQNKQYMGVLVDRNIQDSQNYQDYQWSKIKGEQGIKGDQGVPGKNGIDGRTTYFHTAFANSSDGSIDFSTTDYENKEYLGQYTDFTEVDSTNYRDYQWTKIKGDSGKSILFTIDGDTIFEKTNDDSLVDTEPHIFIPNLIIGDDKITASSSNVFEWFLNDTPITTNNYGAQISLSKSQLNDGDKLKCKYKSNEVVVSLKVILSALEALNKAEEAHENALANTETIAKFKDETGKEIVQIKADAQGLAATVDNYKSETSSSIAMLNNQISSKVSNEEYQSFKSQTEKDISSKVSSSDFESYQSQTANKISSIVTNGTNLFPNGNFIDNKLDTYFVGHLSVSTVVNNQLQITSKNVNTYIRTKDTVPVEFGDVLICEFDYIKNFEGGKLAFGIVDGANWKWIVDEESLAANNSVRHYRKELTVSTGYKNVQFYVGIFDTNDNTVGQKIIIDNVYIKQKYVNQTQLTQTTQEIKTQISNKAEQSYVEQLAGQISQKVSNDEFSSYKEQTAKQISEKVSNDTFSSYKQQTAGQIVSVVSNQQNMWRDGGFEALKLSEYTNCADNWITVLIEENKVTNTVSVKETEYGQEVPINNNTSKALKITGQTNGNRNCYSNDYYSISPGDVIEISYDFRKIGTGKAVVGIRWYDANKQHVEWSQVFASTSDADKWYHKEGKIVVPESIKGLIPALARPYISFNITGSESDYCYFDNVKIVKQPSSQTFQSQTVDSLTTKVSTNTGNISSLTQTSNNLKSEISTVTGDISTLKQTSQSIQTQVSSNTGNISSLTQTTNGLKSQVLNISRNGVNMFPNGKFEDGELEKYFFAIPDMSYISRVFKEEANGTSSDWSLKFKSRTGGNVTLSTQTYVACKAGNTLSINFEYFNKDNASDVFFGAKFKKVEGDFYDPILLTIPKEQSTSWKQYSNEIEIPDDATSVQFLIGTLKSDIEGTCYIANILVNSTEVSNSEFEQTNNKISMIIDDDGDGQSDSYFVLKNKTIELGAEYGFNIKANTTVENGFALSADNISAGKIIGESPAWTKPGYIIPGFETPYNLPFPDILKENRFKPTLALGKKDDGDAPGFKFSMVSEHVPTIQSDNKIATIKTEYGDLGMVFTPLYWDNQQSPTLQEGFTSMIKGEYDPYNSLVPKITMSLPKGGGLIIQDSNAFEAYLREGGPVVIGTDGVNNGKSAIASGTIYVERIQSMDDPNNPGIRFDDRVNFTEYVTGTSLGLSENLSVKGQITVDQITSSDDGGNKGTTFNDRANFTETITGTYGTFSGDITARKFITSSSKELKTDIKNFEMDSAVNDILNVGVKEYIYEDEKEKIESYYENGQPIEGYSELPQEKHVGLIAEELLNYESLRPFIAIEKDVYGDETILGIDYGQLTPLLLAVCQKQQKEINSLNVQLSDLQEKFNDFLISMKG